MLALMQVTFAAGVGVFVIFFLLLPTLILFAVFALYFLIEVFGRVSGHRKF